MCVASAGGCRAFVVDLLAEAPNHGVTPDTRYESSGFVRGVLGIDRELLVEVDATDRASAAIIRAWVLEPDEGEAVRGTVLVLHGIKVPSWVMMVKGRDLTNAGYRVVMVDLRGHGGSTGEHHLYGLAEANDVRCVVDALEREGLIAGGLGVWGVSYGAATAIGLAAIDERVRTVVAVTPFATFRGSAASFVRHHVPFNCRWSDEELNAMIDEAAARAGFDADEADTRIAMRSVRVPVLIIGGQTDHTTPVEEAIGLWDLAPAGSHLMVLEGRGHIGVGLDLGWITKRASVAWFDVHMVEP
jgi:pimeloyl-ACP methyl ester carboxylesterase